MTVYTCLTLPIIMYMSTNMHYHVFISTAIMMSRLQNIWLWCNVASLRRLLLLITRSRFQFEQNSGSFGGMWHRLCLSGQQEYIILRMYSLRYDNDSLCGKNTQVKYTTPYTRKHWLMMLMADHISAVCRSSYYHLRQLRCVVQSQTSDVAKTLVQRFVSCRLDYCNSLLYGVADGQVHRLQSDRNAAARLVTGTR